MHPSLPVLPLNLGLQLTAFIIVAVFFKKSIFSCKASTLCSRSRKAREILSTFCLKVCRVLRVSSLWAPLWSISSCNFFQSLGSQVASLSLPFTGTQTHLLVLLLHLLFTEVPGCAFPSPWAGPSGSESAVQGSAPWWCRFGDAVIRLQGSTFSLVQVFLNVVLRSKPRRAWCTLRWPSCEYSRTWSLHSGWRGVISWCWGHWDPEIETGSSIWWTCYQRVAVWTGSGKRGKQEGTGCGQWITGRALMLRPRGKSGRVFMKLLFSLLLWKSSQGDWLLIFCPSQQFLVPNFFRSPEHLKRLTLPLW